MRHLVTALAVVFALLNGAVAQGVTLRQSPAARSELPKVTTGAAVRAEADVQIRRLHHMLVSNAKMDEKAFDKLQKLELDQRSKP